MEISTSAHETVRPCSRPWLPSRLPYWMAHGPVMKGCTLDWLSAPVRNGSCAAVCLCWSMLVVLMRCSVAGLLGRERCIFRTRARQHVGPTGHAVADRSQSGALKSTRIQAVWEPCSWSAVPWGVSSRLCCTHPPGYCTPTTYRSCVAWATSPRRTRRLAGPPPG